MHTATSKVTTKGQIVIPERNSIVLDSFALIGYLENETFSSRVETILKQAREGKRLIYLHAIHLGEVYYIALISST